MSARPTTTTKKPVVADRCTNQINYSEDSRSNAEINSIGAEIGRCPKVQRSTSGGEGDADPCDRPGTCGEGGEGDPDANGSGSLKTSGQEQYEYGCQQGYITEGC